MNQQKSRLTEGLVVGGFGGGEVKFGAIGKCRVAEMWSFTVVESNLFAQLWLF